jgi:hypothetical protein
MNLPVLSRRGISRPADRLLLALQAGLCCMELLIVLLLLLLIVITIISGVFRSVTTISGRSPKWNDSSVSGDKFAGPQ